MSDVIIQTLIESLKYVCYIERTLVQRNFDDD